MESLVGRRKSVFFLEHTHDKLVLPASRPKLELHPLLKRKGLLRVTCYGRKVKIALLILTQIMFLFSPSSDLFIYWVGNVDRLQSGIYVQLSANREMLRKGRNNREATVRKRQLKWTKVPFGYFSHTWTFTQHFTGVFCFYFGQKNPTTIKLAKSINK